MRGARELGIMLAILVVFLAIPSAWALVYFSRKLGSIGLAMAIAAIFAALLWRRSDFSGIVDEFRDSGQWLKGAKGEHLVHKELALLGDDFIVFNDFHPVGPNWTSAKWNIDHIVVGPTGVFVLDAKNYSSQRVTAASVNSHTKRNVAQAQANALDLKTRLKTWSGGALADVFVVPVVVYVQENARLDSLREGSVRVLPLRLLTREIQRHTEAAMDPDRARRVSLALFSQIPIERQLPFRSEIDAFLAANRPDVQTVGGSTAVASVETPDIPAVCPKCGGALVRKTARKGVRAGKDFLACENFAVTGCRYGFNLD